MKSSLIFNVAIGFLLPYIVLYGFYIQFNGEASPGGGFQAGSILAVANIAYELAYNKTLYREESLIYIAAVGLLLYISVGIITILKGGAYLSYSSLGENGQQYGIAIVELGVGIVVFAVMLFIYKVFFNSNKQ